MGSMMPVSGDDDDVLLEFQRVGQYMKAIAIHAGTGVEVSVVGPAAGSKELLRRTAINKLRYVLTKRSSGA